MRSLVTQSHRFCLYGNLICIPPRLPRFRKPAFITRRAQRHPLNKRMQQKGYLRNPRFIRKYNLIAVLLPMTAKYRLIDSPHSNQFHRNLQQMSGPLQGRHGVHTKDVARQRIEQELQRQRLMALSGGREKSGDNATKPVVKPRQESSEIIRLKREVTRPGPHPRPVSSPPSEQSVQQVPATKTVIIRKRSPSPEVPETQPAESHDEAPVTVDEPTNAELYSPDHLHVPEPEEESVEVKDPSFKAKDEVFSGKNVRGTAVPKVRDASLLHTNLKPKKPAENAGSGDAHDGTADHESESAHARHHDKKIKKHDDISWI